MMHVVLVDPGQQVPYYDRALGAALAGLGVRVSLVTSPLVAYDLGPTPRQLEMRHAFGRLLGPWKRETLVRRPRLRRLLRAAGYGPELLGFLRWTADRQPQVVHWQWSLAPPVEAVVFSRLRALGAAVVYTAHNALPHERRPWHRPAFRQLYRTVDQLVVHSKATASRLMELGVPAARLAVVPFPADQLPRPGRAEARQVLGLPSETPLVLFFGQVRPYKGLDVLLDAMPLLRRQVPEALLLVAGPVPGGRRQVEALRSRLVALGIQQAVVVRAGHVSPAAVAEYFAAADVVALPYRDTDDSGVLATARGCRRAVVASAVGGLPEALASGGGRLVPPGNPAALAEALAELLARPGLRSRLEQEAEAAAQGWTWTDAARRLLGLYRTVLEEDR